ncbi:MAG: hypothetical protein IMX02_05175 [Limnochordaceae bacterium]|nr:hypothetical protein [Limnochordaceae bacterium]
MDALIALLIFVALSVVERLATRGSRQVEKPAPRSGQRTGQPPEGVAPARPRPSPVEEAPIAEPEAEGAPEQEQAPALPGQEQPPPPRPQPGTASLGLAGAQAVRLGIVMSEVLGPPRARRPYRPPTSRR